MKLNSALPLCLLSSLALVLPPANAQLFKIKSPPTTQASTFIPKNTALIVQFINPIQVDAGVKQEISFTMVLTQPVLDNLGNVVIPASSAVSAKILTADGRASIIIDSLIVNSRVIPIQSSSVTFEGVNVTISSSIDEAKPNGAVLSRILGGVVGGSGGNSDDISKATLGGTALGILIGWTSPKKAKVVGIPQGTVQVFTLQSPVTY